MNSIRSTSKQETTPQKHERIASGLLAFVRAISARYDQVQPTVGDPESRRMELQLAEALLSQVQDVSIKSHWPKQVAIIGPTQVGKSTIVNLLLGRNMADVSPLAGFTIHPQGFWIVPPPESQPVHQPTPEPTLFDFTQTPKPHAEDLDFGWVTELFGDWQRRDQKDLSHDELGTYSLTPVDREGLAPVKAPLPPCVVWDTPDFDSLAAREYQQGLLSVAAAADTFVLVLSKEKYADLSVWQMLKLLGPLRRSLVVCLNKMTPDSAEVIMNAFHTKFRELGAEWGKTNVKQIDFDPHIADADAQESANIPALRWEVGECLSHTDRRDRPAGARAYVKQHWDHWIAPITTEHAALETWEHIVDEGIANLLTAYRRDFLEHPQRYDSFHRATAELLLLLEVPIVGDTLSQMRKVLTLPARFLFKQGKRVFGKSEAEEIKPTLPSEQVFLHSEFEMMLATMQRNVARKITGGADSAVWSAIDAKLEADRDRLIDTFEAAASRHHEQVEREVQITARQLFETLKEKPVLLNTLRSARVAADAAAVALAIKTGGADIHGFLLAPAMVGVTTLLTEGAMGAYMITLSAELKEKQYEHAQQVLAEGIFHSELVGLTDHLDSQSIIGVSPQQLQEARSLLGAWEQ